MEKSLEMERWDLESVREAAGNNPGAPALRDILNKLSGEITPFANEPKPKNRMTNKYGVAKKEHRTYNGRLYASKKEANFAQKLDLLVKAGDIDFYLEQVPFRLPGNVVYRLDFLTFAHRTGVWSVHFIEVKGYRTRLGEIKRRQAEELFGITIEVV